jgi:NAD(P)H-dependent flavin oxidoreductase YrpB (nitropropane dioxygenase family)
MIANPANNTEKQVEAGVALLRMIQLFNLLMVAIFTAGSWYIIDWTLAQSVLIGGILASGSFFLLKRDIEQLIDRVASAGDQAKGVKKMEKVRFFLKFYARLTVLGLLLYVLTTKISINMIGLVIGLSTVMLSVVIVVLARGRMIFSVESF